MAAPMAGQGTQPSDSYAGTARMGGSARRPLAQRTVVFVLGTQTASALTDSSWIATATLRLAQKNGKYAPTATYATTGPNAADAAFYVGSGTSATFALQSK